MKVSKLILKKLLNEFTYQIINLKYFIRIMIMWSGIINEIFYPKSRSMLKGKINNAKYYSEIKNITSR